MVVLVVDDDPVSRLVCEHILGSGGYEVITEENAESAFVLIQRGSPEIEAIVCDYNMPGANGLDLLEDLSTDAFSAPPFVLLTGVGEIDELNDPRASAVTHYLTKPVQSGELLAVVASLCTKTPRRAAKHSASLSNLEPR